MDEKKDSLVVKPYKDDVVSSIAIGILCILMGIIFPDDGMYMFWFSIALVIFRACSVANEILILNKSSCLKKGMSFSSLSSFARSIVSFILPFSLALALASNCSFSAKRSFIVTL